MVVLFFYYLSYRNNTIKSYFGYSDLRLVNDIYTSFLPNIILMFIITILFVLFLLNKGIQIAIILELIVQFWLSSIIFVAISYLLVVFFIKISSKDWLSFKGKKPLKSVLLVGIIFLYCITPLIIFGLTETVPLAKENIMLAVNKKRNKKILKHYFYLPLLSAGVDSENEEQLVPSFQAHTKLVNQFYKEGLLLCRPEDSTRDRLNGNKYEKDYSSNEIWVSPNYLNNAFVEVKGLDGKKIKINNNEKQLVVLIPEKLKNSMKKIRDYYKQSHSFYDFEVAQEFSKETLKKQTSTIKFILIKNNPKLLFFKERDSKIKNPILRVLTPNNIQKNSSVYADTIIGEPDYFFVKDQGNLKNVIENKDVYKEFPVQIDAYEYLMSTAQEDVQMLLILFFIVSGLIVLYYIITYFFSNAFITMYSKKFKLNILFGFSLRKVMALYLLVFSVPWTAIFLFSPTKEILISICFILLGSFIISFVNLKKIYRNLNDLE